MAINNYNSPFPSLLRKLMKKEKVKQEELALEAGVTRQSIGQYKDGNTTPDIYTFQKIVKFFRDKKRIRLFL